MRNNLSFPRIKWMRESGLSLVSVSRKSRWQDARAGIILGRNSGSIVRFNRAGVFFATNIVAQSAASNPALSGEVSAAGRAGEKGDQLTGGVGIKATENASPPFTSNIQRDPIQRSTFLQFWDERDCEQSMYNAAGERLSPAASTVPLHGMISRTFQCVTLEKKSEKSLVIGE